MENAAKREELILTKIDGFRDFIIQKQNNITGCFCDNNGYFRAFTMYQPNELLNSKKLKIHVTFSFSNFPSTKIQNDIVDYIKDFANHIKSNITEGKIEIKKFVITFNMDSYALIEIDYERVEVNEEN